MAPTAVDRLLSRLQGALAIKIYFLAQLSLSHIYENVRRSFYASSRDLWLASPAATTRQQQSSGQQQLDNQAWRNMSREINPEESSVTKRLRVSGKAGSDGGGQGKTSRADWTWNHFPEQPKFVAGYRVLSCCVMSYVIVKSLLPDVLLLFINLVNTDSSMPGECYLVGRLAIGGSVSSLGGVSSALFSSFHMLWRLHQLARRRPYVLNYVAYMMQSDQGLQEFLDSCERRQAAACIGRTYGASQKAIQLYNAKSRARSGPLVNRLQAFTRDFLDGGGLQSRASGAMARAADESRGQALFMRDLLFYQVSSRSFLYFKLRANRTMRARAELKRGFARNVLVTISFQACLFPVIALLVIMVILFDWGYKSSYPGCGAQLANHTSARLRPFGELLDDDWAITLTPHRMLVMPFDILENLIVWTDSGYSLTYVHSFLILLNDDLLLYWRNLHAKIELTLDQVRSNFHIRNQLNACLESSLPSASFVSCSSLSTSSSALSSSSSSSNFVVDAEFCPPRSVLNALPEANKRRASGAKQAGATSAAPNLKTPHELEQAIFELQAEISDFFQQVRAADLLISDHLTSLISIWFSTFALLSYHSIVKARSEVPFVVRLISVFDFFTVTLTSVHLFRLHSGCLKSYKLICALMAYDHSRHKRRFSKMLDYYTNQKRFAYTLFQQHPYTPSTFLSIIGWTFSCFFIIESLFKYARFTAT